MVLVRNVLTGLGFYDIGNLYRTFDERDFGDLRRGTGFGLRIGVPGLGPVPLQLDYAWALDRGPDDPRTRFHFDIGVDF